MSTVKISELPVLSSADAADEFVVVDDSAGVTKKITFDSLATDVRSESEPLTASTVTASTVTASTITASGDVSADNVKVSDGGSIGSSTTSNALQIQSDGTLTFNGVTQYYQGQDYQDYYREHLHFARGNNSTGTFQFTAPDDGYAVVHVYSWHRLYNSDADAFGYFLAFKALDNNHQTRQITDWGGDTVTISSSFGSGVVTIDFTFRFANTAVGTGVDSDAHVVVEGAINRGSLNAI